MPKANYKNAIAVLGGGLVKEKGKWRTTDFNESDNFGAMGDRLRVTAADYLFKKDPEQIIIVLGGKGQLKDIPGALAVSRVIKQELVDLGVPADKIIKEEESRDTYQQLMELKKIIQGRKVEKAVIISNKYHLPRLKAMIKRCPKLLALKKMLAVSRLKLKSAEEVVVKHDSKIWQKIIIEAYSSSAMKERIKLEKKGVKDIKEGRYKF